MAHTRLAIVDLSEAGRQPMVSEDGRHVLVFNGEIYNHIALKSSLHFRDFRGHSDTETLLHLLMEQGADAVGKLNGIFAFAFYDREAGTVLLARDRYGVKPVYYHRDGRKLMFASELRPIEQTINPDMDGEALGLLLNLRYVPSPYTLYEGVRKLRPGHYATFRITDGGIEETQHCYLSSLPRQCNLAFDEAVEEYGRKISSAIERQLMSDVEMGMLLSGGVDSAVVAGLAKNHYKGRMKAFTVGFEEKSDVDEIGMARETAEYFGMEHHVVKMSSEDFFDTFRECARIVEEPLATTSFIPMYYLTKLAAEHVKVVLTGQGADEPLGGYGRYQGELMAARYPGIVFKAANAAVRLAGIKNQQIVRGARSLSIKDDVKRFVNVYSCFTPEEVERLTGKEMGGLSEKIIGYYYGLLSDGDRPAVEKMMAVDMHTDLADDLLLYTDKVSMNFSLECRVPMLDNDLVGFIRSLPTSYKVARGKTKIVHKAFAATMLPEKIINRPKLGFQSPTKVWFRKEAGMVRDMLTGGKLNTILDKGYLNKVIDQHLAGYNRETQIFLLLSLNEWLERKC